MMKEKIKRAIIISGIICFTAGCQKDKMPVTTSSPQALQDFLQGRELMEKYRLSEALVYFKKALELDSNFVLAYLYMNDCFISSKEQLENFNQAFKRIDAVSRGERVMVEAAHEGLRGNAKKQQELLEKLVAIYPRDERLYLMLGNFFFGQREWEKAITIYKQALQINPQFPSPYNQIGYSYRYLGNYAEAENAFKKYIKLIPNDPNPYDSYAELLLRMGEYEVSIEQYEKALQINPNFFYSYIGIATNLNFKREYEEARKELKAMYRITSGDAEKSLYYYAVAVSYADEGNLDLARAELEKRFELAVAGHDTLAINNSIHTIVYILLEQGKIEEAKEKTEFANKLSQESNLPPEIKQWSIQRIFIDRALIALKENNFAEARRNAEEYEQEVHKHDNPLLLNVVNEIKGMIDLEEQKYDQVIEELEKISQGDASVLYLLARAYRGKGDMQKAEQSYKQILSLNELNSLEYAILRHKAETELIQLEDALAKKAG
jgi:tetratricopeptide (TPR) repeat protein